MGDSTPGDLMYIYCDSYFIALFYFLQREEERERKMKEKKDCARSQPNL